MGQVFEILHKVFSVAVVIATLFGIFQVLDGVGGLGDNIDTLAVMVAFACFAEMLGFLMLVGYRRLETRS